MYVHTYTNLDLMRNCSPLVLIRKNVDLPVNGLNLILLIDTYYRMIAKLTNHNQ